MDDVTVEGITGVTAADLERAASQGQRVKLLAVAEWRGEGYELHVGPAWLAAEHPLARLTAEQMGVVFHTDVSGIIAASIVETTPLPRPRQPCCAMYSSYTGRTGRDHDRRGAACCARTKRRVPHTSNWEIECLTRDLKRANEETRTAWNANAAFWDAADGRGKDFVEVLEWPPIERLLAIQPGERVLDAACGNGLTSRRLARLGAEVVAFDFSTELIGFARARTPVTERSVAYHVLDATDEAALVALGEGQFDAALCNMALMDMAEIVPLHRAVAPTASRWAVRLVGHPPVL